jgi:hypothetical protein
LAAAALVRDSRTISLFPMDRYLHIAIPFNCYVRSLTGIGAGVYFDSSTCQVPIELSEGECSGRGNCQTNQRLCGKIVRTCQPPLHVC